MRAWARDVEAFGPDRRAGGVAAVRVGLFVHEETCGTCHLQKRAQQMRSSHMPLREGKLSCRSGHNPHGTVSQALRKEASPNETCYRCHAERRGPFLWEHAIPPTSA